MTVNTHAHMSIAYRVACCVAWQIAVLAVVGTPLMAAGKAQKQLADTSVAFEHMCNKHRLELTKGV